MRIKRFDFNYKPFQYTYGISVVSSVPDIQTYDADNNEYAPDYVGTPLVLQPTVTRLDKDGVLGVGIVNSELTNIKWSVIIGGIKTQIATDNTDYQIIPSGDNAGRLLVKRNFKVGLSPTFVFEADHIDRRDAIITNDKVNKGNVMHFEISHLVMCKNSTAYTPLVFLDAASQTLYNPTKDADIQVIKASLKLGLNECPPENRIFVWEIYTSEGTWVPVGTDDNSEYWITISEDGATCTIDRSIMGTEQTIRCRAKYSSSGTPDEVELSDSSPMRVISILRKIPKYEYDILGVPVNIPYGLLTIYPEANIIDSNGDIANAEKVFLPLWYMATNKSQGTLSYTLIGKGKNPPISTSLMSDSYGGVLGLDLVDCGACYALEDNDGVLVEDSDGAIIIV